MTVSVVIYLGYMEKLLVISLYLAEILVWLLLKHFFHNGAASNQRRCIVDAINNCYSILFSYVLRRSQWHDQIEHMLTPILAIDVWWSWPLISLNISPPPPFPPKKSPWEHAGIACYMYVYIFCHKNILCCILIGFYCLLEYLIISTFGVNSTRCGKQFDSEAQTVCIVCQRWHKQVL